MADVPLDRRAFACSLAATGAAALAGCGSPAPPPAKIVEEPIAKVELPKLEPKIEPPKLDPLEPAPEPVKPKPADLLLDLVRHLYPDRLEPNHLAVILGELQRQLARSQVLSSFPLTNADEPASVFAAYRGPE